MNNEQIPDFIMNLGNNNYDGPSGMSNDYPVPDFISQMDTKVDFSNETPVNPNRTTRTSFLKDLEVQNELGIDLDKSFSSNEEGVKSYVDSLSNDDYNLWDNRRQEGYSLDARKALMDNKDLLNLEKSGGLKYKINTPKMDNWVYDYIQNLNQGYETMHPWLDTAEDRLYNASGWLEDKMGKENMMNRWIDKQDPYSKMGPKTAEQTINNYETFANIVQIPKVLAQMVLNTSAKAVNIFDNIQNIKTSVLAEGANLVNKIRGKEPAFDINYGEERSNPIGSYIQTVADGLGVGFTVAYPVATYFFSLLGSQNEKINELENIVFSEKPGQAADRLLKQQEAQDLIEIAGLNAKDEESLRQSIADGIVLAVGAAAHVGGKKLSGSEIVQLHKEALSRANKFSKEYAKQQMRPNYEMKEAAGSLPEGTEVLNEQGKPIAKSTAQGGEFTRGGAIDTGITGAKSYAKMFKEYMSNFYRNYKRGLAPRNPNAPVGELPIVNVKGTTEVKDVPEDKIDETRTTEEIKTPTEEIKVTETKPVKLVENGNMSIGEYIRSISNKITGKKGGMDQALFDKFSTSKDLQSEYINTIDPYLRSNGSKNPENVIKEQLSTFAESIRDQLLVRKLNNQKFRKGQKQYKIETPELEKIKRKEEDKRINDLVRIMSKEIDNPEVFLNYLLKLPEEKVQTLTEIIPDYSKNLGLIQDTLALTKAITSSDLLGKFLQFKSTWGTRNKNYIRKYLYKKLNEAYKEAGVKRNMQEVENIINQMSEKDLIDLEKEMETGELRAFDSEAEFNDLLEKGYIPSTRRPANQNIEEIMNSIWPGTNKTTREYLKEKGVQLSVTDEYGLRKIGGNIQAAYSARLDRILMKTENNPYKGIVYHEFGHRVMSQLGTTQIMDIITHIAKRDKITQEAAFERRAEYFRNYLEYNNVDGKRYLTNKLGKDISSQINSTMEKTKEEIWDLFDLNEGDKNINQILSDVKHDTPKGKEITSRRPEPLVSDMVGDAKPVRYEYLRTIDPNIDSVQIYPYFDKPLEIKFKDGSTKRWEEYRKTLTEEQLNEIDTYQTDVIQEFVDEQMERMNPNKPGRNRGFKGEGKFDYDTLKNEKDLTDLIMDEVLDNAKQTKESLGLDAFTTVDYLGAIKKVNPEVVGLIEKNGTTYVKYLIDSNFERWELPDRPGYVEVKEVPANEYFTEEEIKEFPKELQDLIQKDSGLYQGGGGGLNYSEGNNLKLGNGYYFGSKKQAKEFGPSIIRLEKGDWKFYEPKDTQVYQVEASKNGGKEAFNKKLQEDGYDGIKAYNPAFKDYEYNFFTNPFKKDAN